MGFLTKLLLYLFISTTTLVFSYELVQYARDSMRISNMNTFYRVILYYQHGKPYTGIREETQSIKVPF